MILVCLIVGSALKRLSGDGLTKLINALGLQLIDSGAPSGNVMNEVTAAQLGLNVQLLHINKSIY
jgi:hypothetical protein